MVGRDIIADADEVVDTRRKVIFFGGVDQHTHFSFSFGKHTCVGLESSDAGIVRGTTTVVDFVNQEIGRSLKHSIDAHEGNEVIGKACCDYSFHGVVFDSNEGLFEEIDRMPKYGISTLKLCTVYKGYPYHSDDDAVLRALQAAKKSGAINDGTRGKCGNDRCAAEADLEGGDHRTHRPCHLPPTGGGRRGGEQGNLFEGAKYVSSPALGTKEHLDTLLAGVKKEWLNAVSSDHVGFNFAVHKQERREDFTRIPSGTPGLENRSPVMWTEGVEKGRISRQKFVELCCANPAKICGIFSKKGPSLSAPTRASSSSTPITEGPSPMKRTRTRWTSSLMREEDKGAECGEGVPAW